MSSEKAGIQTKGKKPSLAWKIVRYVLLALLVLLLGLVALLVVRTRGFESHQPSVEKASVSLPPLAAMASRLAAAVRFETVANDGSPVAEEAMYGLHEHLRTSFPRVHENLARENVAKYSLLYTWRGSKPELPALLIAGHLDVVPAEPDNWSRPPFSGLIDEAYIYGRGTMDDKVSVLAVLEAAEQLLREGFVPTRTVYFAFGHDEEIGGYQGAMRIAALLRARGVHLEAVLDEGMVITVGILDGLAKPGAIIAIAEKGYADVELVATSQGGHSSMPPRTTSVGRLSKAIVELQEHPMPGGIGGSVRTMFEYLGPELSYGRRVVMANLWLFSRLVESALTHKPATDALLRTTTAPTMLSGSLKSNVLAQEAKAVVNFRILPGDTVDDVLQHIRRVIDDDSVQIKVLTSVAPQLPSSTKSRIFDIMVRGVRQLDPSIVVAPGLMIALTDSRHYADISDDIYRFTALRLGPEDLRRLHGVDERIALTNYAEVVTFNLLVLRQGAAQ